MWHYYIFLSFLSYVFCKEKLFYIYEWPDLIDRYANYTDRDHASHGVEFGHWHKNHGAGRLVDFNLMEFKTSQFSLFKIIYEKMLIDKRRTLNPDEATTFLIPLDIGMHACFLESNGRMRRSNCPLVPEVILRLKKSKYFTRNYGHDHLLINSVNQNMNYFFNSANCHSLFLECWNCTKLSIDEYMFIAKDRNFELKYRGINWHAVPFPSDYHYIHNNKHNPVWDSSEYDKRSVVISFTGNTRRFNSIATSIREALVIQCKNNDKYCYHGTYDHKFKINELHALPRSSIFCLQPPGDMPTRKSLFDAILSGCIPVLFHPLTARYMYEWHLGQIMWEAISINFDTMNDQQELINNRVDYIQKLVDLYKNHPEIIKEKQNLIKKYASQLQYGSIAHKANSIESNNALYNNQPDAYELIITNVLAIHSGSKSHKRVDHYLNCAQIPGTGGVLLQTSDNCNSTNSALDPFHPPALVDYFLK